VSGYGQFLKLAVPDGARARAELQMDKINPQWRTDRPMAWAGLAAEEAFVSAYQLNGKGSFMERAETRAYDLIIKSFKDLRIEVKTRAVDSGWTDPRMFEWLTIPTHDGRAPIKEVEMVFFCWFSGEQPDTLWALGYLAGLVEFKRRATFYAENQPLPRGGWAPKGGAYSLEVKQLRPFPAGMFRSIPC
jgi:hypothetical protein